MSETDQYPFGFTIDEMDTESFFNVRDWLTKAVEAAGAKRYAGGIGMGAADIDIELDGNCFNISIRPLQKPTPAPQNVTYLSVGSDAFPLPRPPSDNMEADLIAAAPDLYAALEEALWAIDRLTDPNEAMTRGLAALAKARPPPPKPIHLSRKGRQMSETDEMTRTKRAGKDPFGPDSRYYRTSSGEPAPYPNGHTRETWEAGPAREAALRASSLPDD